MTSYDFEGYISDLDDLDQHFNYYLGLSVLDTWRDSDKFYRDGACNLQSEKPPSSSSMCLDLVEIRIRVQDLRKEPWFAQGNTN